MGTVTRHGNTGPFPPWLWDVEPWPWHDVDGVRYCDEHGKATDAANPNGSRNNIAGIYNETGTVLGLMPHPERLADPALSGTDGAKMFLSLVETLH